MSPFILPDPNLDLPFRLDKLTAAQHQLRSAILHFFGRDFIIALALSSNAAQIISDLLRARGLLSAFRVSSHR